MMLNAVFIECVQLRRFILKKEREEEQVHATFGSSKVVEMDVSDLGSKECKDEVKFRLSQDGGGD